MSIESVMSFTHLILCSSLLLLSIFPSIRFFSNESFFRIRWPKYWSFGFSISPSNERPGLVSFRMDWLDRLAVQGTLKSLLQSSGNAIAPFWRKHVWAGLFWKLNSVLRAQLERQANTCTPASVSLGASHSGFALCTSAPVSVACPALALVWGCPSQTDRCLSRPVGPLWPPHPPALPSLLFRTLSFCPDSDDHLGQGLRALAREEYSPRLKQQRGKAGMSQKQRPASALQGWKMRETPVLNGNGRKQGKHGPSTVCRANDWHRLWTVPPLTWHLCLESLTHCEKSFVGMFTYDYKFLGG